MGMGTAKNIMEKMVKNITIFEATIKVILFWTMEYGHSLWIFLKYGHHYCDSIQSVCCLFSRAKLTFGQCRQNFLQAELVLRIIS